MKYFIKSLTILLAFSILLSGCSIYYKKEATLNEAYLSKKPVKLITAENKKMYLKKVIMNDSAYYGVYFYKGQEISFPISNQTNKSLRIKNRTASTVLNVSGIVLPVAMVAVIIVFSGGIGIGGGYVASF